MKYELSLDLVEAVGIIDSQESQFTDKAEFEVAREDAKGKFCIVGTVLHMDSSEGKSIASPHFLPEASSEYIDGILVILSKAIAEREKGEFATSAIIQTKL